MMPRHYRSRGLVRVDWDHGQVEGDRGEGRPTVPEREPVVLQLQNIDPQLESPLFNGTIPSDIRKSIFEYAMAEYVDLECLYPTNTDYTRPNYVGKKKVSINVLLLCKKSYLEARHLPPTNKEHVFWCYRGPRGGSQNIQSYHRRFKPFQWLLVKEVHFFTQQFWLEGSLTQVCNSGVLSDVEKIKITIRRGDWWWNESNHPLAITPQRPGRPDCSVMKADWQAEERGEIVPWLKDRNTWGQSFSVLSSLRELEMEFETYDYKKGELEDIVRHAVKWKFPMDDGMVLTCVDGLGAVKTSSWRGPLCGWMACPWCQGRQDRTGDCKFCEDMNELKMEGKGPMLTVMSGLIWKRAPAS